MRCFAGARRCVSLLTSRKFAVLITFILLGSLAYFVWAVYEQHPEGITHLCKKKKEGATESDTTGVHIDSFCYFVTRLKKVLEKHTDAFLTVLIGSVGAIFTPYLKSFCSGQRPSAARNACDGDQLDRKRPAPEPSFPDNLAPRNSDYTGRGTLFERIKKRFRADQCGSTSQVILTGMGGVGKTQTAREYAYRNREKYNVVWWLQAGKIDDGLCELAQELKLVDAKHIAGIGLDAKKVASSVRVHLRNSPGWLLVIDNARKTGDIEGCFPETGGHVIITTRNSTWPGALHIDRLSRCDSIVLLKKSSGKDRLEEKERNAAQDIADCLGGLPLALSQAGAYVKEDQSMTFTEYLAIFKEARHELWYDSDDDGEDYSNGEGGKHTVASTLLVSLGKIENNAAKAVLEMASLVAPKEIPASMLMALLQSDEGKGRKDPAVSSSKSQMVLKQKVKKAVQKLMRYSLLERGQTPDTYAIHRLLQTVVRDKIDEEERSQGISNRVLTVLRDVFKETGEYSAERKRLNTHILEAAPRFVRFLGGNKELWGLLLDSVGAFLDAGTYPLAKRVLDLALKCGEEMKQSTHGKEIKDIQLLDARNFQSRGRFEEKTGHYDKALEMYMEDLKIKVPLLGSNDLEVATTLNEMGVVYDRKGLYDKALEMYEKSLKIRLAELGKDHRLVADTYGNMGGVYDSQEKFEKALDMYRNSLNIYLTALGNDRPEVATTYHNMGVVYKSQGQYQEALNMYSKCLKIYLTALGEGHPHVAATYHSMGSVYRSQLQYDNALEVYDKSLKIKMAVLGEDHPDVAQTYNNMGNVYRSQGEYDKALELYNKSLKISLSAFDEDHPGVATTYWCMGSVHDSQGQYQTALDMYNKCLKTYLKKFEEGHQGTTRLREFIKRAEGKLKAA